MGIELIAAIILIGFGAGLRTFTGPAIAAWAVYTHRIEVDGSPFAFMSSYAALVIVSLAAVGEYIFDLLPFAPPRTDLLGLIGRFVTGCFSAAILLAACRQNLAFCILGGLGAIVSAFSGYFARKWCVEKFKIKDAFVAIPEDLVAIALGIAGVCLAA